MIMKPVPGCGCGTIFRKSECGMVERHESVILAEACSKRAS